MLSDWVRFQCEGWLCKVYGKTYCNGDGHGNGSGLQGMRPKGSVNMKRSVSWVVISERVAVGLRFARGRDWHFESLD